MRYLMAVILFGAMTMPGSAETYGPDPGDAPDHGVARISLISGDVTVRRGDSGEFVAADLNAPLVERDHVLTEDNGRTEIQFDWANLLRLAPESEVRLAELRDRDFLVQIASGTVTLRVRRDTDSQIELSSPTASFRPTDDGVYRITVRDDASTEITVRSGEGEVFVGGARDFLRQGQTLLITGDPSNPRRAYRSAIPYDEWDRWNEDRDRDLDRSDSYKYVSRDIYGAEDLSNHGRWVYDPPYGWVWVPDVNAGWAPYRVGRWTWVDYYGWTWVSGDPWGWAPYHYGRWYHAPRYGWVWYPGVISVRYTWRPALVVFFGWGPNLGWVSLAPYEVYRPWYGSRRTVVVNNVTVVNNINVINTYRNARFVGGHSGVTSVSSRDFGRRSITVNNYIVGNDRDFTRASDADRLLHSEPSRDSRRFSERTVVSRTAGKRAVERTFVTRPDRQARPPADDRNEQNERIAGGNANRSRTEVRTEPRETRVEPRAENRAEPRADRRESQPSTFSNANAARAESPKNNSRSDRLETVTFPRSESARQPSENSRRADTAVRNETVNNPRNEAASRAEPRQSSPSTFSSANARRAESPKGNGRNERLETVTFPRNEPPRNEPRAFENSRANSPVAAAPSRREMEIPRQVERAAPSPEPPRVAPGRSRSEEAGGPKSSPRSSSAGGSRAPMNSQPSAPPASNGGGGGGRPSVNSQPAPAPAPSSGQQSSGGSSSNGNGGGNSNGNGRGRGR